MPRTVSIFLLGVLLLLALEAPSLAEAPDVGRAAASASALADGGASPATAAPASLSAPEPPPPVPVPASASGAPQGLQGGQAATDDPLARYDADRLLQELGKRGQDPVGATALAQWWAILTGALFGLMYVLRLAGMLDKLDKRWRAPLALLLGAASGAATALAQGLPGASVALLAVSSGLSAVGLHQGLVRGVLGVKSPNPPAAGVLLALVCAGFLLGGCGASAKYTPLPCPAAAPGSEQDVLQAQLRWNCLSDAADPGHAWLVPPDAQGVRRLDLPPTVPVPPAQPATAPTPAVQPGPGGG